MRYKNPCCEEYWKEIFKNPYWRKLYREEGMEDVELSCMMCSIKRLDREVFDDYNRGLGGDS